MSRRRTVFKRSACRRRCNEARCTSQTAAPPSRRKAASPPNLSPVTSNLRRARTRPKISSGAHQVSAKSREDLQYVSAHREDVVALRGQVQDLLARAGEAEDKIASIEARRKNVEEVQAKAALISNLLEDVRVNLETVSEQKAVVDHLTEKLANLDFVTQEAQNTLRMLSRERELAERIEQSIKQLRGRTGTAADEGRQSA